MFALRLVEMLLAASLPASFVVSVILEVIFAMASLVFRDLTPQLVEAGKGKYVLILLSEGFKNRSR